MVCLHRRAAVTPLKRVVVGSRVAVGILIAVDVISLAGKVVAGLVLMVDESSWNCNSSSLNSIRFNRLVCQKNGE